ncbi:MAG: PEP-CTERM sorting domain-containing protein [Planctomycetota bacterium]
MKKLSKLSKVVMARAKAVLLVGIVLLSSGSSYASRNSLAVVHEGDTTWSDYTFSLTVDTILMENGWDFADLVFRASNMEPESGVTQEGDFYYININGPDWDEYPSMVSLTRMITNDSVVTKTNLFQDTFSGITRDPMDFDIVLDGARIQLFINSTEVFDITDPDPITFGGVGVGSGWESIARFNDVIVTGSTGVLFEDNFNSGTMSSEWVTVKPEQWVEDGWLYSQPEPATILMLGLGGLTLLRKRRA